MAGDWKGRGKGRQPGQPSNSFRGGAGQGGGRAGNQPTHRPAEGAPEAVRTWSLKASVEYGGASTSRRAAGISAGGNQRAGSTFKSASGEKNARVQDPEGNFIFSLEINGREVAQFKECSGLKSTTDVYELVEGGMNHATHKLPGQSRWGNITLRYGVTNTDYMLSWRNRILQEGFSDRRNGSIVLRTLQMEEVRRYSFQQAWPVSWDGPSLDASAADLAIETLELAHHGISAS